VKLLYLSEANLQDRLFIKDLVHNFKFGLEEEVILLHAPFGGTTRDTRFVTKRISSLFSETLVYNNAFSGDQRKIFSRNEAGQFQLNTALIQSLVGPINLLIIGPIIHTEQGPTLAEPLEMVRSVQQAFDIASPILFTDNPMSPLANKKPMIQVQADVDQWIKAYEEEQHSLDFALKLSPAQLASPVNYAK